MKTRYQVISNRQLRRRHLAVILAWAANAGIGNAFRSVEHSFDAIIRCDVDLD